MTQTERLQKETRKKLEDEFNYYSAKILNAEAEENDVMVHYYRGKQAGLRYAIFAIDMIALELENEAK